jgi:hypothetical protein
MNYWVGLNNLQIKLFSACANIIIDAAMDTLRSASSTSGVPRLDGNQHDGGSLTD